MPQYCEFWPIRRSPYRILVKLLAPGCSALGLFLQKCVEGLGFHLSCCNALSSFQRTFKFTWIKKKSVLYGGCITWTGSRSVKAVVLVFCSKIGEVLSSPFLMIGTPYPETRAGRRWGSSGFVFDLFPPRCEIQVLLEVIWRVRRGQWHQEWTLTWIEHWPWVLYYALLRSGCKYRTTCSWGLVVGIYV